MRLELRHLAIVVAVEQHGSIGRAARSLGVSQPALSAQLGRIEAALGVELFHRGCQGVRPTSAGEVMIRGARELSDRLTGLVDEVRQVSRDHSQLRFACNHTSVVSAMLAELEALLPSRQVLPHVDPSSAVLERLLRAGELDVTLPTVQPEYDDPAGPGLREEVIVEHEALAVALSADHRLAGRASVDLADLGEDAWLLPPGEPDGTLVALKRAFSDAGIAPKTPFGRVNVVDYWPYVAAGKAVSLCLAIARNPPDVVLRPITGGPMTTRRVLRWSPDAVTEDEAHAIADTARRHFRERELEAARRNDVRQDASQVP